MSRDALDDTRTGADIPDFPAFQQDRSEVRTAAHGSKRIITPANQVETAATPALLQDKMLADDRCGSFTSFPPSRRVRFAPRADIRPKPAFMSTRPNVMIIGRLEHQ